MKSWCVNGVSCEAIDIEVDISPGLPAFVIVGLPDAAVNEARDRVKSAIKRSGYDFPRTRVTVNLAPAHVKKAGSGFDLPIALSILEAQGTIKGGKSYVNASAVGELALDGSLRPVLGVVPIVVTASTQGALLILPRQHSAIAQACQAQHVVYTQSLREIVTAMQEDRLLDVSVDMEVVNEPVKGEEYAVRFEDVIGQTAAKRALEIAAAGMHHSILGGPPGVGKTLLAKALPSILPPMSQSEQVAATMIRSVSDPNPQLVTTRPFRSPHHSSSPVALLGGGNQLLPGEITLAHCGVLFLDELPEFRRDVIEALREPLENAEITIRRAQGAVTYPAQCMLVAAYNPCPCGYGNERCQCSPTAIDRYRKKLSGPFMDRMDIKCMVSLMSASDTSSDVPQETSAQVRERVRAAVAISHARQGKQNVMLSHQEVRALYDSLSIEEKGLLHGAVEAQHISLRGQAKTLKVARTIADLAGAEQITLSHLLEALTYVMAQDRRG